MIGTSFGNSASSGGEFSGLLDDYPNASAAYSIRRLSSAYLSNILEVRRSSDNTTLNIGYDVSGNLDTSSLLSFVGAGDGFVRTWYDQSGGNANNATQTTTSSQPQIVSGGAINTENGKPKIQFDGSTSKLIHSAISGSAFYTSIVGKYDSTIAGGYYPFINSIMNTSGTGFTTFGYFMYYFDTGSQRIETRDGVTSDGVTFTGGDTNQQLLTAFNDGNGTGTSLLAAYKNGNLKGSDPAANPISYKASNTYQIGSYSSNYLLGSTQEIVIYTTDNSANRAGIETNQNDYFTIY